MFIILVFEVNNYLGFGETQRCGQSSAFRRAQVPGKYQEKTNRLVSLYGDINFIFFHCFEKNKTLEVETGHKTRIKILTFSNRMLIPAEILVPLRTLFAFSFSVSIASIHWDLVNRCRMAGPGCLDHRLQWFHCHRHRNRSMCSCRTNALAMSWRSMLAGSPMAMHCRWCELTNRLYIEKHKPKQKSH